MRKARALMFGLLTALTTGPVWAVSDHIMTVSKYSFTLPSNPSEACKVRLTAVTTEAEANAALAECRIPYARDDYSQLRSKTAPADWQAALTGAPIGKVAIRQDGARTVYLIVRSERVIGLAGIDNSFPIRRVLYEGTLDASMQQALAPIHDIDGVIRVLKARHVHFVEDSGTLLAASVPDEVAKALIDHPGDPYVIQRKDNGVIYARRNDAPAAK